MYTQKAEIDVPVCGLDSLESITLTADDDSQKIYLTDLKLVDSGCEEAHSLRAGIYVCGASETVIPETEAVGTASSASTICGNYLYSVCKGVLTVYDLLDGETKVVTELSGLGDAVDLTVVKDGKGLAVASRANGMYFIDIRDPAQPILVSHYDTLEQATGISVCGDYVFVSDRYFGIEILDVSDLSNPVYLTQINTTRSYYGAKEYFACAYDAGYLYISAWSQQQILIYDLGASSGPELVRTLTVDGCPGGIVAEDGFLFVATGYHSQDDYEAVTSVGFGMGNGLEIYDLSDPTSPEWVSASKIDGRYKYSGNDFWKVKVSGNIAVLASTYNGAYLFDVSNPSAPERMDHVTIRIEPDSPYYKNGSGPNNVFSWDVDAYGQAAVLSVALADHAVYLGDPDTGIYRYNCDGISAETANPGSGVAICAGEKEKSMTNVPGYSAEWYTCDGSVYAADSANGMIFVGTSNGILILDENLHELSFQETDEAVRDLTVSKDGKQLFAAESETGVVIYDINGTRLTETERSTLENVAFSASTLIPFPDESAFVVQTGFRQFAWISRTQSVEAYETGSMYYRNFAANTLPDGSIVGYDRYRYYVISAANGAVRVETLHNGYSGERDGIAVSGSDVVAITAEGYVRFDPLTVTEEEWQSIPVHFVPGAQLHGRANANEDGTILVVSDCIAGTVTLVNMENPDDPRLIGQIATDGNPDVASFDGHDILIPLRRGGLLKLEAE
ncbi:MAG: hypothetical protein LUC94_14660 [Clostridiales bacterium]|nr:hypothetical protein [Clostridiales bacterium]